MGIILVTHGIILSGAKNLAVSDFDDACTDLRSFATLKMTPTKHPLCAINYFKTNKTIRH